MSQHLKQRHNVISLRKLDKDQMDAFFTQLINITAIPKYLGSSCYKKLYNITYYFNVQDISKNLKLKLKTFLVDYMLADSSTADLEFSILRNRILIFLKEHMQSTKVWSVGVGGYVTLRFANVTKECSFSMRNVESFRNWGFFLSQRTPVFFL